MRPSPRQVLRAQIERAAALGFELMVGSELEFYLAPGDLRGGAQKHYRELTPSVPYILDYHILATTYDEPLLRQIRNGMQAAGHPRRDLEGRGLAGPAGDQLPLRRRADDGRQPRRLQERREGDRVPERLLDHVHGEAGPHVDRLSCHIHSSLWRGGESAFAGESDVFQQFLAGQIACARELAMFFAPNINSYKRYAAGVVGADDARLGPRQPHVRLPRRRARRRRCASRRGSRAATSIRTSPSRR